VIDDNLPSEVDFVSATGGGIYNLGKVTWNIGTLGPNDSNCVTLTVKVKPSVESCSIITNCSQMNGDCIGSINACENTGICLLVPDVVGKTESDAISAISAGCLNSNDVIYECNDTVPPGYVISQNPPAYTNVPAGSSVDLVVSNSNLLSNPYFEDSGPLPGEPNGPPYYPDPAVGGNPYLGADRWWRWAGGGAIDTDVDYIKNDPTNARSGDDYIQLSYNGQWIGFTQDVVDGNDGPCGNIEILPNTTYTQSIYAKDADYVPGNPARFGFKLEYYAGDPNEYYPNFIEEDFSPVFTLTNKWQKYEAVFDSPNEPNLVKFRATYFCTTGTKPAMPTGKVIWFDNAFVAQGGTISDCDKAKRDAIAATGHWTPLPGDLNDDCYVNIKDLGLFVQDWLKDCGLGMTQTGWNATNLLLNPSFEQVKVSNPNEPNEWTFDYAGPSAATVTVYKHDGGHTDANYIETDAVGNADAGAWAVAYQTHYIAEKRRYRIEAYVKTFDDSDPAELKLDFKDSGGAIIETYSNLFAVSGAGGWTLVACDSNAAPVGSRMVSAVVSTSGLDVLMSSYVMWDDVKLTMIGEAPKPCEELQFNWGWDFAVGDLNRDCVIDFKDYAIFASYWLECNAYPYIPTCHYQDAKHKD
jgi:hypothetical protein